MPRGDGTGPMGLGPMTGRGLGTCAGFAAPGYANGWFGAGHGRGFRRMYCMTGLPGWARYGAYPYGAYPYGFAPYGAAADVDEKEILQNQADFLAKQLSAVRDRLKGLEKDE